MTQYASQRTVSFDTDMICVNKNDLQSFDDVNIDVFYSNAVLNKSFVASINDT